MITTIERLVVEYYNETRKKKVKIEQLHEKSREGFRPYLRQLVFFLYIQRHENTNPYWVIAGKFYDRDRITAWHGRNRVADLYDVDKEVREDVDVLTKRVELSIIKMHGVLITTQEKKQAERIAWQRVTIRLMKKRRPAPLTVQDVYNEYNLI